MLFRSSVCNLPGFVELNPPLLWNKTKLKNCHISCFFFMMAQRLFQATDLINFRQPVKRNKSRVAQDLGDGGQNGVRIFVPDDDDVRRRRRVESDNRCDVADQEWHRRQVAQSNWLQPGVNVINTCARNYVSKNSSWFYVRKICRSIYARIESWCQCYKHVHT